MLKNVLKGSCKSENGVAKQGGYCLKEFVVTYKKAACSSCGNRVEVTQLLSLRLLE